MRKCVRRRKNMHVLSTKVCELWLSMAMELSAPSLSGFETNQLPRFDIGETKAALAIYISRTGNP